MWTCNSWCAPLWFIRRCKLTHSKSVKQISKINVASKVKCTWFLRAKNINGFCFLTFHNFLENLRTREDKNWSPKFRFYKYNLFIMLQESIITVLLKNSISVQERERDTKIWLQEEQTKYLFFFSLKICKKYNSKISGIS